jgi:hypothetical protein
VDRDDRRYSGRDRGLENYRLPNATTASAEPGGDTGRDTIAIVDLA